MKEIEKITGNVSKRDDVFVTRLTKPKIICHYILNHLSKAVAIVGFCCKETT